MGVQDLLKAYSRRLTNLTGKNRSILLLKLSDRIGVDLHSMNFLNGKPSFSIIESLVSRKNIVLCPQMDSRDDDVNIFSRKLRKLQRTEKFIFDERGSKDLYVGWPFLRGKFSDGTPVRCPLMYFPVDLELRKNEWVLVHRSDSENTLNTSFLLAYGHYNGIKISEELLTQALDDFDDDMTVFRTSLYQLFRESEVEFNFNRDNFADTLSPFKEFTKKEFEENEKNGEIKMYPEAVLGIFPQSGSNLTRDYSWLEENGKYKDMEEFFYSRTLIKDLDKHSEYFRMGAISEEKTLTTFPIDAYQENALKSVKKGYSVVVQGPPGTGKSQLICNLISDFTARGKNVLVVSQKRAALDVVFKRLSEKGLADFSGLVHDFKYDRKSIYEKIARQIRMLTEYEHDNNNLDMVQVERRYLQTSRQIDQFIEDFDEYKKALFDDKECGLSVKELYLTSDPDKPYVNLKQEFDKFTFVEINDFLLKLREYTQYGKTFNRSDYPLLERKSFKGYGISELKKMEGILDEIPIFHNNFNKEIKKLIGGELTLEDSVYLSSIRARVIEMINLLNDENTFASFKLMTGFSDSETDSLWLSNTERVLMECYKGDGPEMSLRSEELGQFQEALQRRLDASRKILRFIRWRLFSRDRKWIKKVITANQLPKGKEGFKNLITRVDNRLNLEHNISKLRDKKWLLGLPGSLKKVEFQNWFHTQKNALRSKLIFNTLRQLKEQINVNSMSYEDLSALLENLYAIFYGIPERKRIWELYFSKTQIENILNNHQLAESYKKILRRDFESLCEFDNLIDTLKEHEKIALDKSINKSNELGGEESTESIFLNSVKIAWIEYLESKYPVLRSVSSLRFKNAEVKLQNLITEKEEIANQILLLKIKERTYEDLEYNRLNNRVTYRDLDHQVNKKRRIWPLRRVMSEFNHELFNLIPCWLASPESVSAIFPMEDVFDLVIFDEASQCFVENGIPAMMRGKQLVIAGDSKQLRPNDLYTVRYDEDHDDDPLLEISSVLDLAERYLKDIQLSGHYRSKSFELIQFSNEKFYDNQLFLLPDKEALAHPDPGISYHKVNGVWEQNRNDVEATFIIKLVEEILGESPEKDIGVVTFNARQQDYILDKMDEYMVDNQKTFPDSLFVKNIENVQGDERDIIIFSTGYAPDPSGRIIMQFGSLNAEFGENRLNVAVTRAREKIHVVSSILPPQLKVEDTKNRGPKLLKEYLDYCLMVSKKKFKPSYPTDNHGGEWYLKKKLIQWAIDSDTDFTLSEELPLADLTIKHDNAFIGLIRTDDDHYYKSVSAKDAHVYRPLSLMRKNWPAFSTSSREYWNNKKAVYESLTTFMNNL